MSYAYSDQTLPPGAPAGAVTRCRILVRAEVTDTAAVGFAAGSTDGGAYLAGTAAGGILLAPAAVAEFTTGALPPGWTVTPYLQGGSGRLGEGGIALDGARVGCDTVFRGPRHTLDFSATFAARPDQHAGFGVDYVHVPWVMFSTRWGRRLYARTHHALVEDKQLRGNWFGEPHHYRIQWEVLDITFFIDGNRAAYLLVPVPGYMRALAGNQRLGGPPLEVQWMRVSPYAPAGRFTSRVMDAGAVVDWLGAAWEADVPAMTSLALSVRTGDVARPGRAWSRWAPLPGPHARIGARSRYLQYRADLATADVGRTPVLRRVSLRHRPGTAGP